LSALLSIYVKELPEKLDANEDKNRHTLNQPAIKSEYQGNLLLCYDINTMKILITALYLFAGTLLIARDYKIKIVQVLPIESYPAQATAGKVTIAADPYSSDEKSFKAFDAKDLNSRGFFPIHIIIRNNTSTYLTIRTKNVILISSSGEQLYTTPAALVVDDIYGLSNKTPPKKSKESKDSKDSKWSAGSSQESQESKEYVPPPPKGSPLTDFASKELVNASLDPGSVIDGFLFFYTPDPKKNLFEGSTLYIPRLEEEGTKKPIGPFAIRLDAALVPNKLPK
jgi:hypothetical protein